MEAVFWRNLLKQKFTFKQLVPTHGFAHIWSSKLEQLLGATYLNQTLLHFDMHNLPKLELTSYQMVTIHGCAHIGFIKWKCFVGATF